MTILYPNEKRTLRITADGMTGKMYADNAIAATALATIAGNKKKIIRWHLFAIAIELSLKSLCLRNGATEKQCEEAGHKIQKIVTLAESFGVQFPESLKKLICHQDWFDEFFLNSRYPSFTGNGLRIHTRITYPKMIAQLLEIPSKLQLEFKGGGALAEIEQLFNEFQKSA